jgi:spore coat polysaccharide biosynthesis protein SpsF (cytidylyltransferase family)
MIHPLCIVQARLGSTRLPGKMLLGLGGMTLIERAVRTATLAFGWDNVIVAHPDTPENAPLVAELERISARRFAWAGPENDVLSRVYHCSHTYRWHPDSVIVRYTPDDPWKDVASLRRVAAGERLPVEMGGEAFTLAQLDRAYTRPWHTHEEKEHITHALFPIAPPKPPAGVWSIDTQADYDAAIAELERGVA